MADSQMTPFVPREMKLAPREAYLAGVQHRTVRRFFPQAGKNGYNSQNNTIEWTFSEADGLNLRDTCVQFKLDYFTNSTQATADTSASVTSAIDLIDRIEFFHGSTSVLSTTVSKMRMLTHILMKNELSNDGWFKYAGKNLVGWNSYDLNSASNTDIPAHATGGRVFQVPLWCIHPALQVGNLPCLGEQVTIRLTLAPDSVLATRGATTSVYRLNDVELHAEKILYEPAYKQSVMAQITSSEGMSIPMIDFDIQQNQNNASVDVAFTQRNQRSNCLSLVMWNAKKDSQRPADETEKFDPNLNIDLGSKVDNLKVFSGDRSFLPQNGIGEPVELLGALERCAGGYSKENCGAISWEEYTDDTTYPAYAPVAVSLERTELEDTDFTVTNRGLSAFDFGVDSDIQVQMKLSSALNAGEELYSALVYEKSLVMRDGAISVEA